MLTVAAYKRLRGFTLDVDIPFDSGVTTLVGPSGAGKSTILRLAAGLLRPDAGAIRLGDTLLDDAPRRYHLAPGRRGIGMVFQEYALFPHLSVAANVGYGLQARRMGSAERRRRVAEMLERLGIGALAHERPDRISGGQRQRVALARALVTQPRALLLDEPLAALDVQTRAAVRRELRAALADLAIPTLLVSHDYADALVFHRRIVILTEGTVVQDGSHANLLAHPRSRFVAEFTGINFFEGVLLDHSAGHIGRIRVGDDVDLYAPAEDLAPGPIGVALRPWDVTIAHAPPDGSARNVLRARVREVLPVGSRVRLVLAAGRAGALTLVAEITPEAQDALGCVEGQQIYAAFKATALTTTAG